MNRGAVGLFVACAVIPLAPLAATRPSGREKFTPTVLRVLTYNIHHGEGVDGRFDLQRLADIMNGAAADVIALQEVDRGTLRAGGVDQLAELARLTGMHPVFGKAMNYQGGEYGVGVLSRAPVRQARNRQLPGSPEREPRTALTVELDLRATGPRVSFTTTHLDQGRDLMDQVAQASYLAAGLSAGSGDAHILAGDLNTRPDTLTMQILARRWTDTFAEPPPDANGRPRRRIDYVMVQPASSWRTVEARYIDAPLASDHQPLSVSLEWAGEDWRKTPR
jgi:endonuclease/exonuclease/phosphatase family metal-dependent hydrolase